MVELIIAIAGALVASIGGGVFGAICGGLTTGAIAYAMLPTVAWGFAGVPALLAVAAVVGMACRAVTSSPTDAKDAALTRGFVTVVAFLAVLVILPPATSWSVFRATAYRGVIGAVDTLDNQPAVATIDPARLRSVDAALARTMAERVLGEDGALGSQVDVGEMTLQLVQGEWLWVAPLNHAGFLRWAANDGTPGYVTVSAVSPDDPRAARLVLTRGGKSMRLRYNRGSVFGQDPDRVIYHAFPTEGRGALHFEIDEAGRPVWIAPLYRKMVGFGGARVDGAVVLDAESGEMTRCATADCPAWIDMLQDETLAIQHIAWWGEFAEGWLNPSGKNKLAPTPGVARVIDAEGHQYFYTGITSVNADQGTTGYMMTNTRTGKATYYRQAGATEQAAMSSAQGAVQEKGYSAEYPVPYNIAGAWTYFVPLKDQAGFPKAYAFVAVENDQIVGTGTTPAQAMRAYRQRMSASGRAVGDAAVTDVVMSGRIRRFAADVRDGTTSFLFSLEGVEDRVFVGTGQLAPTLPLAEVGDTVEVRYVETTRGVVELSGFRHLRWVLRTSATEQQAADSVATPAAADSVETPTSKVDRDTASKSDRSQTGRRGRRARR